MNCRECKEHLYEYLDRELTPGGQEIRQHIADCRRAASSSTSKSCSLVSCDPLAGQGAPPTMKRRSWTTARRVSGYPAAGRACAVGPAYVGPWLGGARAARRFLPHRYLLTQARRAPGPEPRRRGGAGQRRGRPVAALLALGWVCRPIGPLPRHVATEIGPTRPSALLIPPKEGDARRRGITALGTLAACRCSHDRLARSCLGPGQPRCSRS